MMNFIFAFIALSFTHASGICPSNESLLDLLSAKEAALPQMLKSIQSLNNRIIDGSTPLSGLFSISVEDEDAVTARVLELRKNLSQKSALDPFHSWLECTKDPLVQQRVRAAESIAMEINRQRISFLSLGREERVALAKAYASNTKRNIELEDLEEIGEKAESNRVEAQASLDLAEAQATTEVSAGEKELAGYRALIAKYLVNLEASQIEFVRYQSEQSKRYSDFRSEIGELTALAETSSGPVLAERYKRSAFIWRKLVDHIFDLYLQNDYQSVAPPPEISREMNGVNESIVSVYEEQHKSALQRSEEASASRVQFITREKEMIADLLLTAGATRSVFFQKCRREKCEPLFEIREDIVFDIFREVKVVPFKAFSLGLAKSKEFQSKMESGIRGWVDISKQIVFLILLLLIPFVVYSFFVRVSDGLDKLRRSMISRSMMGHARRTKLALWIGRVTPFFSWIAMWLTVELFDLVLGKTDLSELAEFLVYFQSYFIYRILREALAGVIQSSFARGSLELHRNLHEKVLRSTIRLTRIGLIEFMLLKAVSDAVREAYVYAILSSVILIVNLALFVFEAGIWEEEIWVASRRNFNKFLFDYLLPYRKTPLRLVLNPLLFVWVVAHFVFSALAARLASLDLFKWLASEVFRKRLERKGDGSKKTVTGLPQDYLIHFHSRDAAMIEAHVVCSQRTDERISDAIRQWAKGEASEDAIILSGNRGMGKSSAIQSAIRKLDQNLVEVTVSNLLIKYTQKEDFYILLSNLLKTKIENTEDILVFDKKLDRKRVIILDDAQNLFLAVIGGFEAYYAFLEVASLPTFNLFWCISINTRSWDYLRGVFGDEHFFGKKIECLPWRDVEIQELILKRHALSGFSLEFDDLIRALGEDSRSGLTETEIQFFRLLWGQSRGNPRSALVYWLSSITWVAGRTLRVGVPTFLPGGLVNVFNDDALFVLAAVTRHENLTSIEAISVTGLSYAVVRKCLKMAEENEVIWVDDADRHRVTPKGQYLIDNFLLGKNFLHEGGV